MPLFSYRAINDDNKEVRGSIDAPDLNAAKAALEAQNLEATDLHEASRSQAAEASVPQPSLRTTFAFEGTDPSGTVRRGTMQSETKYQAFERLKQDQKLMLTMLSPLGVTPQYRDPDLENWQRKETASKPSSGPTSMAAAAVPPVIPAIAAAKPASKNIGFTLPEGAVKPVSATQPPVKKEAKKGIYHPILATLRLYAGWLLAWYGLFVALGYYTHVRTLPLDIPFVEAFFVSPLIFSFIVAIFFFLMLGALHRAMHGRILGGIALTIVGIAVFTAVRMSV